MGKLYGEKIKELAHAGRRGIVLPSPQASVTRSNPMCGDTVTVDLGANGAKLKIGYSARGCLICLAACAHMAQLDAELGHAELARSLASIGRMFESGEIPAAMELFAPVAAHRSRHQCVLLPYLALEELLQEG